MPGALLVGRYSAEEAPGHCHHQRRGDALAGDVAYAEEEFVVADEEVVQVASYFPCGHHDGSQVHVTPLLFRRQGLGQHSHLYLAGNAQLVVHLVLLGTDFLKMALVLH